jgi:hypothetical protein
VTALWFRHADTRFSFLWESADQPSARWHARGDGPVQYLADTPDGAWAEFLRHEGITEAADLAGVERALWTIEVDETAEAPARPGLDDAVCRGDERSYRACREEARRLRDAGQRALEAPSAALVTGGARGQLVDRGVREAPDRDGRVLVLFGSRPSLRGWLCGDGARPSERLLPLVRPL